MNRGIFDFNIGRKPILTRTTSRICFFLACYLFGAVVCFAASVFARAIVGDVEEMNGFYFFVFLYVTVDALYVFIFVRKRYSLKSFKPNDALKDVVVTSLFTAFGAAILLPISPFSNLKLYAFFVVLFGVSSGLLPLFAILLGAIFLDDEYLDSLQAQANNNYVERENSQPSSRNRQAPSDPPRLYRGHLATPLGNSDPGAEEVLRHNLEIVGRTYLVSTPTAVDSARNALDTLDDCYEVLDQLLILGCSEYAINKAERALEEARDTIYDSCKRIVAISVLSKHTDVNNDLKREVNTIKHAFDKTDFEEALKEILAQLDEPESDRDFAEEIGRLKALSDSLLTGTRGNKLVTISDIYPKED